MGIRVIGSTERVRCLAQITQRRGQRAPFPDSESPAILLRFENKCPQTLQEASGTKRGLSVQRGSAGASPAPPGDSSSRGTPAPPGSEHAQWTPRPSQRGWTGAASRFCEPPKGGAGRRAGPVPGTPWHRRNSPPTRRSGGARCSGATRGHAIRGQPKWGTRCRRRPPNGPGQTGPLDLGHLSPDRRAPDISPYLHSHIHSTNSFWALTVCLVQDLGHCSEDRQGYTAPAVP